MCMEAVVFENGEVVVRKRGADRVRRGHLWIYRSDITDSRHAEAGAIVRVCDERGTVVGKAFYSSKSQIALRLLTKGDAVVDESFFRNRFDVADDLRERLRVDPFLSRRVFSEGDLLPGLIVDRYGDCLVVQSLIQGTDRLLPLFNELLASRYRPKSILIRNDSRVRELEGLELKQEVIGDPLPSPLLVSEDGRILAVALTEGQKTGSYLDQRDNHRMARLYARGRALDAFCYAGGFALQTADLCEKVEAVDTSAAALELGRGNAA